MLALLFSFLCIRLQDTTGMLIVQTPFRHPREYGDPVYAYPGLRPRQASSWQARLSFNPIFQKSILLQS